jgi:nitric oxide reductase subunit C
MIFFTLVALFVLQSGFTYTSATDGVKAAAVLDGRAREGERLYRAYNCTACHQFYGLGGYMGPDLTNVTTQPGKGPGFARAIILHGTQRMPRLGVTEAEADALVAYLQTVAATGTYPIRHVELTPWGTYPELHRDGR